MHGLFTGRSSGDLSWGTLQFLAGAIAGASSNIQSIFSTFSSIADQSLFLTDLVEFFHVKPTAAIEAGRDSGAAPDPRRHSCSRTSPSPIQAVRAWYWTISISASSPGAHRADR